MPAVAATGNVQLLVHSARFAVLYGVGHGAVRRRY